MTPQFGPLLYTISVWALPAIIAITFHEAAHGFVSRLLGDDTAYPARRAELTNLEQQLRVGERRLDQLQGHPTQLQKLEDQAAQLKL